MSECFTAKKHNPFSLKVGLVTQMCSKTIPNYLRWFFEVQQIFIDFNILSLGVNRQWSNYRITRSLSPEKDSIRNLWVSFPKQAKPNQCPLRFWVAHLRQNKKLLYFLIPENHLTAWGFQKWNMSNEKSENMSSVFPATGCSWTTHTRSWDQYLSQHVQTCFFKLAEIHLISIIK